MTRQARPHREHRASRVSPKHRSDRPRRDLRAGRERGASAVEYGLLVAGVTAAFLIGAIGLQSVSKAVFDQAVTSVEQDDPLP